MTTYHASPTHPRPARRRRMLRACAAAAVIVTAGLAAPTGAAAAPADPVAEAARDAIPQRGGITHHRMRLEFAVPAMSPEALLAGRVGQPLPAPFGPAFEDPAVFTGVIERWNALEPLRDRTAWIYLRQNGAEGTIEQSYADGTLREWQSWGGEEPTVIELSNAQRAEYEDSRLGVQRDWLFNVSWSADPIGGVRTMLDGGMLHSAGQTTFEGRTVLRLLGEEPGTEQNGSPGGPIEYEYLVDAWTFEPVRASGTYTTRAAGENGESAERYSTVWTFPLFERLPMTDENRRLLVAGGPR
jgi:hypothetical protein